MQSIQSFLKNTLLLVPSSLAMTIVFLLVFSTTNISAQSKTSYSDLQAFEQTTLQALLAKRPMPSTAAYDAQLFALGYKTGIALAESDLAVRIARAEIHKQFYAAHGDEATIIKTDAAIAEMRKAAKH